MYQIPQFSFFLTRVYVYWFLDRKRGREREKHWCERETLISGHPMGDQTYAQGIEPATFWCLGQCFNKLNPQPGLQYLNFKRVFSLKKKKNPKNPTSRALGSLLWFPVRTHGLQSRSAVGGMRGNRSMSLSQINGFLLVALPTLSLKNKYNCPGWCGSVDWMLACEPKGRWFDFPVRAQAWVAGQVHSWEHAKGRHTLMFLFLFLPPFPFP